MTGDAWVDALWPGADWHESDGARITEAFRRLSAATEQWPSPKAFKAHLPRREVGDALALPARVFTEQERIENLARLTQMLADAGIIPPNSRPPAPPTPSAAEEDTQ